MRQFGKGRVVYFPFDLDRTYWEILATDHGRLLSNAVDWALNGAHGVQVEGPGLLDVTLWRQENSVDAHLVNLTNPMMMRGFVRESLPLAAQKVTLSLPQGVAAGKISLLESGGAVRDLATRNGTLNFTVPGVSVHEVVAIDLRADRR